jgi:aminopeptidase
VLLSDHGVERELLLGGGKVSETLYREELALRAEADCLLMSKMDCYIGFTSWTNMSAHADVEVNAKNLHQKLYWDPLHRGQRIHKTRWVVLRYPTPGMAQAARMSDEAFEDFYFRVCTLDYAKMSAAMDPLAALLDKTGKVRIVSPGTDLSFSVKGIPSIKCCGRANIPDGELYTAPVKDSVNGVIAYNTPSAHGGFVYEKVTLTFKDGKIADAAANDTKAVNAVFDTDPGARYVGEFAFGVNPFITFPMNEILFDEKIAGSIHFTPGNAYDNADNGNRSAVHWDLVLLQDPAHGGGEIYLDDVLVRKDGLFVLPELQPLNPDQLGV